MKSPVAEAPPPPPEAQAISRVHARRRPFVLAGFLLGLILFWLWIPNGSRLTLLRNMLTQRGFVIALFAFLVVALSLLWVRGQDIDNRVFLFVNLRGYRPKWLDGMMWLTTQVGNGLVASLLAYWQFRQGERAFGVGLILGTLTLGVVVESLKVLTNRARPFLVHQGARIVGWREPGRSFPSGHTAQAFFLMTTVANYFKLSPLIALGLYAVAVLVGVTRVYLGMHFPRDVVGGAVLGLFWGIVVAVIGSYLAFPQPI